MLVIMDIRDFFPKILPGLQEIKRRCPEVLWTPRQVYMDCVFGNAVLIVDTTDDDFGFIICYVDFPDLVLWIAYSPLPDAQDRYLPEILKIARAQGCTRLLMQTPRRGFMRKKGWVPIATTYAMEVDDE